MDKYDKWTWTKGTLETHSILLEKIVKLLEEKKDLGISKRQTTFIRNDGETWG